MTESELLKRALADGIIDFGNIQKEIELNDRKKYLEMHEYKVWQGNGKWYTYLYTDGKRKLVKKSKLKDLESAIVQHYKKEEDEPTIEVIFNKWLDNKLNYGEITIQTYNRYKNDYIRFIQGSTIDCKIRYITEEMLEDYIRTTIKEHELTAKAWSNLRTLIYGIFKHAKKNGYTKISITAFMGDLEMSRKVFSVHKKDRLEQVFTDSEKELICNYLWTHDHSSAAMAIILSFYTGLRAGELSALKWTDIDDENIHVHRTEIHYKTESGMVYEVRDFPKTESSIRNVVLTTTAKVVLDKLRDNMDTNEYIFIRDNKRIHGHVFSNKLKRLCRKLDITPRSLHKCRKTYASTLSKANVPLAIISDQLGHSESVTTQKHYIFDNCDNKELYDFVEEALE